MPNFVGYVKKENANKARLDRVINRLEELAAVSDDANCISRFYGTKAHVDSRKLLVQWMEKAGMEVYSDNIGNLRGSLKSNHPEAKHFVIGSHYDSVHDAGKYDGPLGVILGLETAQEVFDKELELPFHLTVAAFADEEGGRFNTAYLGSSVLAGNFENEWLERTDDDGVSLRSIVEDCGGSIENIANDSLAPEDWLAYFEVHIEQGPVLCKEDLPFCLVTGIAAQTRIDVEWTGVANHAGTVPMQLRQDALCAAAEFTLLVEKTAQKFKDKLVATVGKLNVGPNTSNVIPGKVLHCLDIRSLDDDFLKTKVAELEKKAQEIAHIRNVKCDWKIMQSNASVNCDDRLMSVMRKAAENTGLNKCLEIPSGAGHDGVMISKVAPISMLFVRCTDGISHNPAEHVESEDIAASISACDQIILELKNSNQFNF